MKYKIADPMYMPLIQTIKTQFLDVTDSLYDGRNTLKVLHYLNENIVVKSFKIPHLINKVAYGLFRDSKAKKSYENSMRIVEFVPKPIAYIEFTNFGLLTNSYFLCEKYDYDFTIREPLIQKDFEDKEAIFKALALFTYQLHEKSIEHLDYSPGNILIKKIQNTYEFKIIDVNRMQFKTLTQKERLKNFSKLWARDEDLTLIVKFYAKLIGSDEKEAIAIALKASQQHKDKKNLKKRLKGKKVVD